eukprot:CAMPEP_0113845886 /NCGR_PEP_ID=MMETSP0372-20130328/1001_1 /TAXON_ID=340204 /ORGANISM="Lankesteria abbotti" /LENGTH=208 /DNA_ID=CAMNT_0000814969 /DNA_START=58 /DNA_END=681 /DNA_ORIENTATION=- /assembly_acc=CAM_ASM_000359
MSAKFYNRLASGTTTAAPFKSKFGAKILQQCGWKDGEGLGQNKEGQTECVQLKKREDGLGLGAAQESKEVKWENWWREMYDSVARSSAAGPNDETSAGTTVSSSSEEDESTDDDDVERMLAGGRKHEQRQVGKLARLKEQELQCATAKVREFVVKKQEESVFEVSILEETKSERKIKNVKRERKEEKRKSKEEKRKSKEKSKEEKRKS